MAQLPSPSQPEILEVTVRDGSYLIDFQFTAQDTALFVSALEGVGFRWIEVGHGIGLNASNSGHGTAAATDEEYMEAAAQSARAAHWGMFFIPGIGRPEDLRRAASCGMHFVRIGTNASEVAKAAPFIELARDLGLLVSYNAMKSYAVSPAEFGRIAAQAQAWGAHLVCLVDSAGGMDPYDVRAYLGAAKDSCDVALGFHGHDNLTLALANTLQAIDLGAVLVDSSLQGAGRSAGNTVTEALVAVLQRRGLVPGIDLNLVLDLGQNLLEPALHRRGLDPLAITAGLARFHSSFTPKVRAYAERYGVDIRELIVRLCEQDQVNAPDELLESLGRELAERKRPRLISIRALARRAPRPTDPTQLLGRIFRELKSLGAKSGKWTVLNVVQEVRCEPSFRVSGNIQSSPTHVIGSVSVTGEEQLRGVLALTEGRVDVVLLDVDVKACGPRAPASLGRQRLHKTTLLAYSDSLTWLAAVEEQSTRLLNEECAGKSIFVAGDHAMAGALADRLIQRGARVVFEARREQVAAKPYDLVIVWTADHRAWDDLKVVDGLIETSILLDAGIGSVSTEMLAVARRRGALTVRVNIWPTLCGVLLAAHESSRVRREAMGRTTVSGVAVVAGGVLGNQGDVIVDDIHQPRRVIGVADGKGGVLFDYQPDDAARVEAVEDALRGRLVMPRSGRTS
jgi:4-hydroxy-2-oxovalerate aldolase